LATKKATKKATGNGGSRTVSKAILLRRDSKRAQYSSQYFLIGFGVIVDAGQRYTSFFKILKKT